MAKTLALTKKAEDIIEAQELDETFASESDYTVVWVP